MKISMCYRPSITPCRKQERMGSASVTFEQPLYTLVQPGDTSGSRGHRVAHLAGAVGEQPQRQSKASSSFSLCSSAKCSLVRREDVAKNLNIKRKQELEYISCSQKSPGEMGVDRFSYDLPTKLFTEV